MSTGSGCLHCKPGKLCQYCQDFQFHKKKEHAGRLVVQGVADSICHDNEMMKKDPVHANSYKYDKEIATNLSIAAAAFADNERRQKEQALEQALEHMKPKHTKPGGRGWHK